MVWAAAGWLRWQNARIRSIRQRLLQGRAQGGKLFRSHQPLHAFKQLAFFLADVGCQLFYQRLQPGHVQFASGGARKEITQQNVAGEKFLDQRLQLGKASSRRKQLFFFGGKMKGDFLFEYLLDLSLPCFQIDLAGLDGAIQAHTQRQAMLVLVGKRDQVLVSKHVYLLSA